MKAAHDMPFGATVTATGVRFGLWGPTAQSVELELGNSKRIAMERRDDGWYELTTRDASAGTRYKYRIDGELSVPDPASRFNPDDVHDASVVVDPRTFEWADNGWRGRPWHEAVVYELHVGTFSPEGTFAGVEQRLDYLVDLGVSAIELMPLADFPGARNWGYDGVLPFAPDATYGTPDDLKSLVAAAHARNLMVLIDVVYNHFGPEGNYLYRIAAPFFTERHETPWGAAMNFDGAQSRRVREFFIHNALYWLEEFRVDGLRLDAVHAIIDDSTPDFLDDLARRVRDGPGRERAIHLVLENDRNAASRLARAATGKPVAFTAQWNDDFHHVMHLLLTGERHGYYTDYTQSPLSLLGRCLAQGFAYQGEASAHRNGCARGEPSNALPPDAFVNFLQNHDQVGNRAFGERLHSLAPAATLRSAVAVLLLAPSVPLLFMGEEFAAASPFLFFCDFGADLAQAVRNGRRAEFAGFPPFDDAAKASTIPDPGADQSFMQSQLDWASAGRAPHAKWHAHYRDLLDIRRTRIVPLIPRVVAGAARYRATDDALDVRWRLDDGRALRVTLRLRGALLPSADGDVLWRSDDTDDWSVRWTVERDNACDPDLDALCERYGIGLAYHDIWHQEHVTSDATKQALLAAMGELDVRSSPLIVLREGEPPADIDPQAWRVTREDGTPHDGPLDTLPLGYHRLSPATATDADVDRIIAVCPRACHRPDDRARMFGPAIQLYALRSARNWGIGDFTDLARLVEISAAHGASFLGVNPLHEPFLHRPEQASPYSPSSRLALNPLYLDVEAIEDFATCAPARDVVTTAEFQAELAALRRAELVDYANVARVKRSVLMLLFEQFRTEHLTRPSDRSHAFRAFAAAQREHVADAALFDALQADFHAVNAHVWGWPAWPEAYRDRASSEVADFARDYAHRVDFYLYLQWQADIQLSNVAARARECGMSIGVYRDLAVGANPGGAETWHAPQMFATSAHVGAPPDEFNRTGQDWGLPPWNPNRLRESGYAPWLSLLRANMRHAGGLRIDHVMGLLRLYWIPRGMTPREGAYVRYPLHDLLALLALESVRHRCIVVGEDLGTVPDEVRAALHDAGVLSYRVLFFERGSDGGFIIPAHYPAQALVTIATHDLPTLRGFVEGIDLGARDALGLFADADVRNRMYAQRDSERIRLADALAREGLAANWPTAHGVSLEDTVAAHRYVARTPCALMTIQLEDVFGQPEQANLPATTDDQYPNWQRKVAIDLEDWQRDGRFAAICAAIRGEGRGPPP